MDELYISKSASRICIVEYKLISLIIDEARWFLNLNVWLWIVAQKCKWCLTMFRRWRFVYHHRYRSYLITSFHKISLWTRQISVSWTDLFSVIKDFRNTFSLSAEYCIFKIIKPLLHICCCGSVCYVCIIIHQCSRNLWPD